MEREDIGSWSPLVRVLVIETLVVHLAMRSHITL